LLRTNTLALLRKSVNYAVKSFTGLTPGSFSVVEDVAILRRYGTGLEKAVSWHINIFHNCPLALFLDLFCTTPMMQSSIFILKNPIMG
jgi:hypothetical protein